jgi:hypothetical protein
MNLATLVNALLFQCLWFSVMVFDQQGMWLFLSALVSQFTYQCIAFKPVTLVRLPLMVMVAGIIIDAGFSAMGVFSFPTMSDQNNLAHLHVLGIPVWLVVMWLGFALTLQHSLRWLCERKALCVAMLSIFGPVSYLAGRGFEVIQFDNADVVFVALAWSLIGFLAVQQTRREGGDSALSGSHNLW